MKTFPSRPGEVGYFVAAQALGFQPGGHEFEGVGRGVVLDGVPAQNVFERQTLNVFQDVKRDVVRRRSPHAGERLDQAAARFAGDADHQIHADRSEPGPAGILDEIGGLGFRGFPAQDVQHVVIEGLHADAQAGHAGLGPNGQRFLARIRGRTSP